jgi:hypothetical protein
MRNIRACSACLNNCMKPLIDRTDRVVGTLSNFVSFWLTTMELATNPHRVPLQLNLRLAFLNPLPSIHRPNTRIHHPNQFLHRRPHFSSSLPALFFIAATTCLTLERSTNYPAFTRSRPHRFDRSTQICHATSLCGSIANKFAAACSRAWPKQNLHRQQK